MKKRCYRVMAMGLAVVFLSACGSDDSEPQGVIPEGYKDAVKKADGVEDLLKDTEKKRLEELDEATP